MRSIRLEVIAALTATGIGLIIWRAFLAVEGLSENDETQFLAFPLTVALPGFAFAFLATRRNMISCEGALMQLGSMIQLLLILLMPRAALYLTLGFPVVFLVVEVFENKLPVIIRDPIKRLVLR